LKIVQNGQISDFRGLLTLTLTLDLDMVITFFFISHREIRDEIEIEETFCGRTDTRTDGNLPPIVLGRLPKSGSRPKNKILPGSPAVATAWIALKSARARPRQCTQSAPNFIQVGPLSS